MLKPAINIAVSGILLTGILGFGGENAKSQGSAAASDEALYKTGVESNEKQQYLKARQAFQTLINAFADSDLADSYYFRTEDLLYTEGEAENLLPAEGPYKHFIIFYPKYPKALDEQMKIIAAQMKEMRSPERNQEYSLRALQEIKNFIEQFPESDYIPMVRQFLAEIQKALITVERIEIRGNRRVPEDTILGYIKTESGQPYSRAQLDSDIGALYRAGYFDYVEIEESDGDAGKILTFIVEEKPLIRSIEYTGNESFTESDILNALMKNEVGLTVDSQYDQRKIGTAQRVLKDLMIQYGKPEGTVRTQIENVPPNYVRLHFILDESGE